MKNKHGFPNFYLSKKKKSQYGGVCVCKNIQLVKFCAIKQCKERLKITFQNTHQHGLDSYSTEKQECLEALP